MKLLKKYAFLIMVFVAIANVQMVSAQRQATPIYMYGFAASFNDSTVYFTEIQEVTGAVVGEKTKFLYGRDAYSHQLKTFLQGLGEEYPTCITAFATTRKQIEKKYLKLRKRYLNKEGRDIRYINATEFKFSPIAPEVETTEAKQ